MYHVYPSNAPYLQHPEVGTHRLQSVPVQPELHLRINKMQSITISSSENRNGRHLQAMEDTYKHWLGVLQYPPTE